MAVYGSHLVRLEDGLRVIFDKQEQVCFGRIWHAGGDPYHEMIDIIYELYLAQEDL
jgi:hypothetical protein